MWCVLAVCGLLTGVVRDTGGAALQGAAVTVSNASQAESRSTVTDGQGRFEIRDLPAARYTVTFTYEGFEPMVRTVDVGTGAPVSLTIVLSLSGLSETVTVTATRTGDADVQSPPGAITVLASRTLDQLGARTIEQLADVVPTLSTSQNGGLAVMALRGISTNFTFPGSDPSVTVNLDGVYLARPAMAYANFLDVERVEVLRGPQGTLYGRNAVGGAINIITRDPGNTLEARGRIAAGDYDTRRVEAMVSGPIARDKVMGSIAILRSTRDGLVADLGHPDAALGSEDAWSGRAKLRVVLGARTQLMLAADHASDAGVPLTYAKPLVASPGFTFDRPADFWTVRNSHAASGHNLQRGASAKLTFVPDAATTVTSLTGYRRSDFRFFVDGDDTQLPLITINTPDRQHQLSQELTIARRRDRHAWVAGAFFFGEHDEGDIEVSQYAQGIQLRPFPRAGTASAAAFGERTEKLTDRISLIGGVRFTHEQKDFASSGGTYRLGTPVLAIPASFYSFTDSVTYNVWTPKAAVQLRLTSDAFAYASAIKGFKSGGFNLSTPEVGRAYQPERTWSYEAGLKSTVAGGAGRLNATFFYNDYQDLQVLSFVRSTTVVDISNAASAVTKGVEVEGSASARGWTLSSNIAWLDARYGEYFAAAPTGRLDVSGRRLNYAPEWSGNASAQYQWAVGGAGTAFIRGDSTWRSRAFFTAFNTDIETQRRFGLVHARAGFAPRNGRWDVALYVRNLTNQPFVVGTSNISPATIGGHQGEPRRWGAELTVQR